jgi:hypothetical protein
MTDPRPWTDSTVSFTEASGRQTDRQTDRQTARLHVAGGGTDAAANVVREELEASVKRCCWFAVDAVVVVVEALSLLIINITFDVPSLLDIDIDTVA